MQIKQSGENKSLNDIFIKNINGNKANAFKHKKGAIIKAAITAKENDTVSLQTKDNFKFKARMNMIYGDIGDELTFEVSENGKDGVMLKQILDASIMENARYSKLTAQEDVRDLLKRHNMSGSDNILNPKNMRSELEEQKKIMMAKAKIQRTLSYTANNVSQSAINELLSHGLSLDKISINILNNVMKEIEDKPPQELTDSDMENIVSKASAREIEQKSDFAKKLNDNGLPVSEKNIKLLETLAIRHDDIKNLDEASVAEAIRHGGELTLESVYVSKYSSNKTNVPSDISEEKWFALKSQTEKILTRDGMAINDKNLAASKFLLENELAVNKENIEKYNLLNNIEENVDINQLTESAIKNIKKNLNPYDVKLFNNEAGASKRKELAEGYKSLIEDLPGIKPENIDILFKKKIPLTLNNIRMTVNSADTLDPAYFTDDNAVSAEIIIAKRQLAQIQLKMTKEAAARLINQDIDINTLPLEEALRELEKVENIGYAKSLKIMDAADTPENIGTMSGLYNKISGFAEINNSVFKNIIMKDIDFTIEGVSNSIQAAKVMRDLENFATAANAKYGDSFINVKEQFRPFLENMCMESSDQNIRAAAILSRNNMDVTEENIISVNVIDIKLNRIQNTLHPNIAANMIKEGLNPAVMHIDEALEYIDKFNGIYGEDLADKISKHIMEMDDNKSIDKDTREGMIAIYRMLNAVQHNDSIAIGASVKSGVNLTLGNLLDASDYHKNIKNRGIDVRLDENTRETESLNIPETNIRNILSKAYANALQALPVEARTEVMAVMDDNAMGRTEGNVHKAAGAAGRDNSGAALKNMEYNVENIRVFTENAAPSNLNEVMRDSDIKQSAVADLANELRRMEAVNESRIENNIRSAEFVQNIAAGSHDIVHWMEVNRIPLTFNNIVSAKNLINDPFFISNGIEKIMDEAEELFDNIETPDLETLKSGANPAENLRAIYVKLEEIKHHSVSRESIENINVLRNTINFNNMISAKSGGNFAQIPLRMHNKISGLNMYVLNDKLGTDSKIYMSLNTKNLGDIQIYMNVKDDGADIKILSDRKDAADFLRKNIGLLKDSESGNKIKDIIIDVVNGGVRNIAAEEISVAAMSQHSAGTL